VAIGDQRSAIRKTKACDQVRPPLRFSCSLIADR
jgi:hypothetical protein